MSNLSEDTLRKILDQIRQQAISSQKALMTVRSQIQAKEKDKKILQLTIRELSAVPQPTPTTTSSSVSSSHINSTGAAGVGKTYKGVGKMFVFQPRDEVDKSHKKLEGELNEEIGNLVKKAKYLEKQFNEANAQLKDIFHSQQREQQAQS